PCWAGVRTGGGCSEEHGVSDVGAQHAAPTTVATPPASDRTPASADEEPQRRGWRQVAGAACCAPTCDGVRPTLPRGRLRGRRAERGTRRIGCRGAASCACSRRYAACV